MSNPPKRKPPRTGVGGGQDHPVRVGAWRRPGIWLGFLALIAIGFTTSLAMQRTSPGPLSAVHAQVIDLHSMNSCATCHGGWFGDLTSSCKECHGEIAQQIDSGKGLHGRLAPGAANQCGSCHGEHVGEGFQIVNRRSFAMAGIADAASFDHGLIGFTMAGKHLEQECSTCHVHAEVAVLAEGEHRFLGLAQDCSSCHEDPHGGRMALSCTTCHNQNDWQQLTASDHSLHLSGGHGELDCTACHDAASQHGLEAVGAAPGGLPPRQCTACHESPHMAALVPAVARSNRVQPGNACAACHLPEQTHFRDGGLAAAMQPAWHAAGGFPLDGAHAETACGDCHDPAGDSFAARHPGRSPRSCQTCHEDVHMGQFADSPLRSEGCVDCHTTAHFAPSTIDAVRHEATGYTLVDSHAEAGCADCHLLASGTEVRIYHGTVNRCDQCHKDAHNTLFDGFPEVAEHGEGTCAACHKPTSFGDVDRAGFRHEHFTGVPVDGAHDFAGCAACHQPLPATDELGRSFARASDVHGGGDHAGCATCHSNPHGDTFRRAGMTEVVNGQRDCARCHTTASFRGVAAVPDGTRQKTTGFEHGAWTGFPLRGAHGAADCSACHDPAAGPQAEGMTLGQVSGRDCADCHSDPHGEQFAEEGRVDCSRCHTDTDPFTTSIFKHDVQSRFVLGEAHDSIACSACHKPFQQKGQELIRYRPLPRDCAACHGDARTPFRRKR